MQDLADLGTFLTNVCFPNFASAAKSFSGGIADIRCKCAGSGAIWRKRPFNVRSNPLMLRSIRWRQRAHFLRCNLQLEAPFKGVLRVCRMFRPAISMSFNLSVTRILRPSCSLHWRTYSLETRQILEWQRCASSKVTQSRSWRSEEPRHRIEIANLMPAKGLAALLELHLNYLFAIFFRTSEALPAPGSVLQAYRKW